jgi:uncharacterized protein YraI
MKTLLAVAAILVCGVVEASAQRCVVSDPTSTQLNVRTSPDGPRRGNMTLPNGLPVVILEVSRDGRWAFVRYVGGQEIGWVFRDYLDC